MFAWCTSKNVLANVVTPAVNEVAKNPKATAFITNCFSKTGLPVPSEISGQTGPAGCTGPKCQGVLGCINRLSLMLGPTGATGPSGAEGATGPSGATGANESSVQNEEKSGLRLGIIG